MEGLQISWSLLKFTEDMKILQAVVLFGTLAALASANRRSHNNIVGKSKKKLDPVDVELEQFALSFLRKNAFPKDYHGDTEIQSLDHLEVVPGKNETLSWFSSYTIVADITAKWTGSLGNTATYKCTAVVYQMTFNTHGMNIPPIPPPPFDQFDPSRDVACVTLRNPFDS